MNNLKFFSVSVISVKRINAILGRKAQDQYLGRIFIRLFPAIGILVSPVNVKMLFMTLKQIRLLSQHMGKRGIVKYLKVCSICLQQCIGGHVLSDVGELGIRISRTNSGIPKIIPALHRAQIRKGNTAIIRLYLTVFALYRVIDIPAKVKIGTITDAFKGTNVHVVDHYVNNFQKLFIDPAFRKVDFYSKLKSYAKIFVIWKSSAGTSSEDGPNPFATHPITVIRTGLGMLTRTDMRHALFAWFYAVGIADGSWVFEYFKPLRPELISTPLRSIWNSIVRVIQLAKDKAYTYSTYSADGQTVWNVEPVDGYVPTRQLGKLALKQEAAGKMRVFAMVDPFTQWALYPLHKIIMFVLRRYEMDGTFNQLKPLGKLRKSSQLYSLDLSSATDRLPISLQVLILGRMLKDEVLAQKWATLLVGRSYSVPKDARAVVGSSTVRYSVGQPMGALSSWAMLALTHHFIVQCAAWDAGFPTNRLYTNYALLGDDLVLGDKQVMISYLRILGALGVECGLHKSLVSHSGSALEFAKRTVFKGVDVSPISLTEFSAAVSSISEIISFSRKYNLNLAQVAKTLGYGWRVISSINKPIGKLNAVLRGISIASIVPDTPEAAIALFSMGAPVRKDIQNYMYAFIKYEFGKILKILSKEILKDTNIDLSYAPIYGLKTSWFKVALQEVIDKLLTPIRNQSMVQAGQLKNHILNNVYTTYWTDLGSLYVEYLRCLKEQTNISRNMAGLELQRTQHVRGRSPSVLKIWNRWSPYFQGKDANFNTFVKSTYAFGPGSISLSRSPLVKSAKPRLKVVTQVRPLRKGNK